MSLAHRILARPRPIALSQRLFHTTIRRSEHIFNADAQTFQNAIQNEHNVVLVDFYADWCNPCKMLSPILESLTADPSIKSGSGRSLDLVTVDTDAQLELAQKYKVRSLPTVIAFKDGQPVSQFSGALPEQNVRKFLQQL